MRIQLPQEPDGKQFEDFISACLLVLGYFVETRMVLQEGGKEILELDVVASPAGEGPDKKILFEAKKKGFTFPLIFKLFGQRTYLNIHNACIASREPCDPGHEGIYTHRSQEMGVRILQFPIEDCEIPKLAEPTNPLPDEKLDAFARTVWFIQISRRLAYWEFKRECRNNPKDGSYQLAREYDRSLQESFFQTTPIERAQCLYDAYHVSPKLTGQLVELICSQTRMTKSSVWNRLGNSRAYFGIQHLMYLENNARLAILKNALDDVLERGDKQIETQRLKIGDLAIEIPLYNLPSRFLKGLEIFREHPHRLRLPYLFQIFLDLFGGYIFPDDLDELNLLSELSQIPSEEIVDCLDLINHFFGPEDGDFFYYPLTSMKAMKMVPSYVRGGGCFFRLTAFALENYNDKYPLHSHMLANWHNTLISLLDTELGVPDQD